jgi:hypothetical protein
VTGDMHSLLVFGRGACVSLLVFFLLVFSRGACVCLLVFSRGACVSLLMFGRGACVCLLVFGRGAWSLPKSCFLFSRGCRCYTEAAPPCLRCSWEAVRQRYRSREQEGEAEVSSAGSPLGATARHGADAPAERWQGRPPRRNAYGDEIIDG